MFSFPRLFGEDLQDSLCGVTNILEHTGDIFRKNVKCAHSPSQPWNRINKGYRTPCTRESIPSFHHDNISVSRARLCVEGRTGTKPQLSPVTVISASENLQ